MNRDGIAGACGLVLIFSVQFSSENSQNRLPDPDMRSGRPVRLQFVLKGCDLYSFKFN
jgi:hypothetical protein